MNGFDIFVNGRYFDTLFYPVPMTCEEVRNSLDYIKGVSVKPIRVFSGE